MAKTWRIHRIFNARKLRTMSITNGTLLGYLAGVMLIESLMFGIWNGVDPLQLVYRQQARSSILVSSCESASDAGMAVFIAFKVAFLCYGVYLCAAVKDVDDRFNESAGLSISLSVSFTVGLLCIPMGFLLRDFVNAILVVYAVGVIVPITLTLAAQFAPKFYHIYWSLQAKNDKLVFTTTADSDVNSRVSHGGSRSPATSQSGGAHSHQKDSHATGSHLKDSHVKDDAHHSHVKDDAHDGPHGSPHGSPHTSGIKEDLPPIKDEAKAEHDKDKDHLAIPMNELAPRSPSQSSPSSEPNPV